VLALLIALLMPPAPARAATLIDYAYGDINAVRTKYGLDPFNKTNALLSVVQTETERILQSRKLECKQFTPEFLSKASGLNITKCRTFVVRGEITKDASHRIKIAEV
jgi:hypothetical protein